MDKKLKTINSYTELNSQELSKISGGKKKSLGTEILDDIGSFAHGVIVGLPVILPEQENN